MADPTYSDPDSLDFIDLLEYDELQQAYDPQHNPHSCPSRPNRSCDDQRCCSSAAKGHGIPLSQELDEADRHLFNPVPIPSTSTTSHHNAAIRHQESAELFLRLDSNDCVVDKASVDLDTPVTTTAEFFGGEELQYENEFDDAFSGSLAAGGYDECSRSLDGFALGDNENEQLLLEGI